MFDEENGFRLADKNAIRMEGVNALQNYVQTRCKGLTTIIAFIGAVQNVPDKPVVEKFLRDIGTSLIQKYKIQLL